jgi:hypothetical protein
MKTFIFCWLISAGAITPDGSNDGRPLYTINREPRPIEHAYQGEIFGMFENGKFRYDEELKDLFTTNQNK